MDILWIKILEIMDMAWIWSQFLDEMDYEQQTYFCNIWQPYFASSLMWKIFKNHAQ